jgi:hypothetical protein
MGSIGFKNKVSVENIETYFQKNIKIFLNFESELKKINLEQFINFVNNNSERNIQSLDKIRIKFRGNTYYIFDIEKINNNFTCRFMRNDNNELIVIRILDRIFLVLQTNKLIIRNTKIGNERIPLFFENNGIVKCNVKLPGLIENYCTIATVNDKNLDLSIYYGDFIYTNTKNDKFIITKNSENVKNTFISFEDICRLNSVIIPFFWKLNYLPAYKKLKENSLFERNVFKTIIGYI